MGKVSNNFTIIPNDNSELYAKNSAFNILHVYIVERVRSFETSGKTCYISNEQLAEATGASKKTISRALKLLIDEKVLWAGYHFITEDSNVKKQRVLRIFNKDIEAYYNKKEINKMFSDEGQIVQDSESNCPSQIDKMTTSDGQNVPLVYKEKIKEDNYKKGDELDSSLSDSHNAHPEQGTGLFEGVYDKVIVNNCRQRRSLDELEDSFDNEI